MESYLNENFDVKAKHSSEEVLEKWRNLCSVVKNPKRRFRFTANLSKRYEAAAMRRTNQEKLRIAVLVSKAAFQFISGVAPSDYTVPEEVKAAGFEICADELGSIVESHDVKKLKFHGGVDGLAGKLKASPTDGLSTAAAQLSQRQELFGINKFAESEMRGFWVFVWEALQDMTLMILGVCAFVSLIVGIATEGWPKGSHDGLGIVASILLVVFVTATSDYRQSLQFRDLDKEKKKITVQVTRNGFRQKLSIYDLLPGDIVHLAIGDQVPADGLFLSGFSVVIDESSLTGESEPVMVNAQNPFLMSGTKVQDGSCKMMITTVGMRTQWGKLMATLTEGGDDETPLQVKLNGVATIIGKIGLFFAIVTFAVLVQGMFMRKLSTQSPNPKHSRGDIRKDSEPVHVRKEERRESDRSCYGRGGVDSHKRDRYSRDDNYGSKRDEYNRHGRDAHRSSYDPRGGRHSDRRRVETEHSRSRNDSDRHSRDKYSNSGHRVNSNEKGEDLSSGRRHADSRVEDKEKDYVRGRDFQDEKRGSRWSFGDRYSRDERKEHEDPEIRKEKDVHVKSPRDRSDDKCLATENRDTHSKKLKGFISAGSTNEEKQTSILKPEPGDVNAAKVAAMQAAELVNKNLVGTGYLTTDQKKKLLWGKKRSTASEESAHRWDNASALIGDPERQEKFNKLMGVKANIVNQEQNLSEVEVEKQKELQMDLEKQYTAGLRRRDGRTVGLGL